MINKWLSAFLLFLVTPLFGFCGYKYDISICAIFQNEAPYLAEWIEYHMLLGVDHFYLYNNNSDDSYKESLKYYIKNKKVTLIDWPTPKEGDWTNYQVLAYNDCLKQFRHKTKWLAVIDIDEFIHLKLHDNLQEFLKHYEDVGGVTLNWQVFGTSWVSKIPKDQLLIDALYLRAESDHPMNKWYKSIMRTERIHFLSVHNALYLYGYFDVSTHKIHSEQAPIETDIAVLNHYWTRDEDFFFSTKVARRQRLGVSYTEEQIQEIFSSFNQVPDTGIQRYSPKLKAHLDKTRYSF